MEQKKNFGYKKLGLILFILLLIAITIVTFAWYVLNREVEAGSDENMMIITGSDLEVSVDGENWGSSVKIDADTASLIDITGNGINFYNVEKLDDDTGKPDYSDVSSLTEIEDPEGFYLDVSLKFRTAQKMDVYLARDSYVKECESINSDSFERKSPYGDFSRDGIVGAARVAFYDITDGNEELKNIWIPNDKYQIEHFPTGCTFTTEGTRETAYTYLVPETNEISEKSFTVEDYCTGKVTVGNYSLATKAVGQSLPSINNAAPVLSFDDSSGFNERTVLVRIWFEGTDRESITDLCGGMAKYLFSFVGISKKDSDVKLLNKNDLASQGGTLAGNEKCVYYTQNNILSFSPNGEQASGIVYSFDGIEWQNYGSGNAVISPGDSDKIVYVKSVETDEVKSSNYIEVTIPANS